MLVAMQVQRGYVIKLVQGSAKIISRASFSCMCLLLLQIIEYTNGGGKVKVFSNRVQLDKAQVWRIHCIKTKYLIGRNRVVLVGAHVWHRKKRITATLYCKYVQLMSMCCCFGMCMLMSSYRVSLSSVRSQILLT